MWSYDIDNLATSLKDQVRLIIGDTVEEAGILQDEEINFYLQLKEDNVKAASIECCKLVISKLSGLPDFTLGPYKESNGDRLDSYYRLFEQLQKEAATLTAPEMKKPTTAPIFHYDMMSLDGTYAEHGGPANDE